MGKHSWRDMWGFFHWHSNVADRLPLTCDWSPEREHLVSETYESAEELDAKKTNPPSSKTKRSSRSSKKRSIRARIKSLIAEDFYKENRNKQHQEELCLDSSLMRTYSKLQLESLEAEISKICTDWRHEPRFDPKSVENDQAHSPNKMDIDGSENSDDVLEIFKVDKQMFMRELQQSSERFSNFISGMGMSLKPTKSRSFLVGEMSQSGVLKPSKLENKQKEVWPPQKSQAIDEKKRFHRRSSSLNETLGMYTRLVDNTYQTGTKLHPSKSLKLGNESGQGSIYYRRIRSLSNGDLHFSDLKFHVTGNDSTVKDSSLDQQEDTVVDHIWNKENGEGENVANVERNADEFKRSDSCRDPTMFSAEMSDNDQTHVCSMRGVDMAPHVAELQFSQGLENRSSQSDEEISFSPRCEDQEKLLNHPPASYNTSLNLGKDGKLGKTLKTKKKNSDLHFVRRLLDQSNIALSASEMLDQQLSSQLFEKVEACWPHDEDELTGLPDFYGCWHHMMLFHLVNEMLAEVYDASLPYYPKPLSYSCHVRPFPSGNYIIEEVCSKVGRLMNMNPEKEPDQEYAFGHDLASDSGWMNLQFESECTALELEDVIFDEILEEFISSYDLQVF